MAPMKNDRINALKEKIAKIQSWTPRLKKLAKIKKKQGVLDYSDSQFCRDHGFEQSRFSRWKRMADGMPREETIDKIEAALTAEGV